MLAQGREGDAEAGAFGRDARQCGAEESSQTMPAPRLQPGPKIMISRERTRRAKIPRACLSACGDAFAVDFHMATGYLVDIKTFFGVRARRGAHANT